MTETALPPLMLPELLHSAANKLRANTEGATPGQRDVEIVNGTVRVATFDGQDCATTGPDHDPTAIADAKHYASWPPEAAVALADWFVMAADRRDIGEMTSALGVARVLLAGTPMLDDYERAATV